MTKQDSDPATLLDLTQTYRVRSYEVEPNGDLRIVTLLRMLQESAWQHARLLGKGFIERGEGGLFWVLSRLRIRIDRYPQWGQDFSITTWPVGTKGILALREFRLKDGENLIGRAASGWLVLDGGTGRPLRPQSLVADLNTSPGEFPGEINRIPILGSAAVVARGTVQKHDIDQHHHVNNAAYLEWMIDAVAAAGNEDSPGIGSLEIDYVKELRLGDVYVIAASFESGQTACEVRTPDQGVICRARLTSGG